tara:strand:- start:3804 stop:4043 length:240 start_codon:yes stop_codon:yes gene_type:complete
MLGLRRILYLPNTGGRCGSIKLLATKADGTMSDDNYYTCPLCLLLCHIDDTEACACFHTEKDVDDSESSITGDNQGTER